MASRLIDRPIRPLFPEGFFNEVQIVCTVLSHDLTNEPTIPAMIGASAALALSGVPFMGPVACAEIGYIDGEYVLNPTLEQSASSTLDLMVAGTTEGVLMVESEAKELSEEIMLGAVDFGHKAFQPVIKAILKLKKQAGKKDWDVVGLGDDYKDLHKKIKKAVEKDLQKAYSITTKAERYAAVDAAYDKAVDKVGIAEGQELNFDMAFEALKSEVVRTDILEKGSRVDGRDLKTVRPIDVQVGVLPRTHGSALFTRGETQALVVSTLGTAQDEQMIDALEGEYRERFMLHYNFPPYSVNETGRMSGPGRREIGHGKLAWRAIRPHSRQKTSSHIPCVPFLKSQNQTVPLLWRPFAVHPSL